MQYQELEIKRGVLSLLSKPLSHKKFLKTQLEIKKSEKKDTLFLTMIPLNLFLISRYSKYMYEIS